MPKFTIEHETSLQPTETYQKVRDYLENSKGIRKLDADLTCTFDDSSRTGHVKGSKFECDVAVTGEDTSRVAITVNIGFLLTPFKGQIESTLKTKMSEILG